MNSRFVDLDPFGFKFFDQLFGVARSFDIEGVVRHAGKLFFRSVEKAEAGFTSSETIHFYSDEGLLCAQLCAQSQLVEARHCIQIRRLKVP